MDPLSLAADAADAASLGVQLAQDLYRLAAEYSTVECQIGRIAQAFVDLNLTLADLASALPQAHEAVSFAQPCMDHLGALVARIAGVQKTFRTTLNDGPATGKGAAGRKQAKAAVNKLGQLKAVFPGSGAAERFTEMEWMRNTLALMATVARLSTAQAQNELSPSDSADQKTRVAKLASLRIASETLTSAIVIYVRTIEQKLAGPDDDEDLSDDDEEPITGPGCLLFTPAPKAAPKPPAKGKAALAAKSKDPAPPKLDTAIWVYEALRDRIKECDRAGEVPSQFVDWLVEQVVDSTKPPPQPEQPEQPEQPAEQPEAPPAEPTKGSDEPVPAKVEAGAPPATAADDNADDVDDDTTASGLAAYLPLFSRKAAKKKGKNKGKAVAAAAAAVAAAAVAAPKSAKPAEPEPKLEEAQGETAASSSPDAATTESDEAAVETADTGVAESSRAAKPTQAGGTDAKRKESDPPTGVATVPDAPSLDDHLGSPKPPPRHADAERPRDAKSAGRFDASHEHDDLPPPYPSPEAFMPPGRGPPPFGHPPFPFQPPNPMAYPPAPAGYDDYPNMPYMQPQQPMFPSLGFFPMQSPYAPPRPFYGGRPSGPDAYGYNEFYDNPFPARAYPGMRRRSTERPRREGPSNTGEAGRSGPLVPRRRPTTGTVLNAAMFREYDEDEYPDDEPPRNRRRASNARRRRESNEPPADDDDDNKENEANYADAGDLAEAKKAKKGKQAASAAKEKATEAASKEEDARAEKALDKGKKKAAPSKQVESSSSSFFKAAAAKADSQARGQDEDDSESDAETVDIRDVLPATTSNTGKKRNAKSNVAVRKRGGRHDITPSPPPVTHLPTPPSPPSAPGDDRDGAANNRKAKGSGSGKAKTKAEAEKHDDQARPSASRGKAQSKSSGARNAADDDEDDEDGDDDDDDGGGDDEDGGTGSDDNNAGRGKDDDNETKFSPDTEPRVFTPPPTPPHAPHPEEAPHAPPHAPAPGVDSGGFARRSGPGGMPYPPQASFMPQQRPMLPTNPFIPRSRAANDSAGFGRNMDAAGMGLGLGMGYGMGMGGGAAAGGMDSVWASPWPNPATAAAAAAAAPGMNGPAAPQAGFGPAWMRRGSYTAARGPPPPPGPPPRASPPRWGRYRSRTRYSEGDEGRDTHLGHSDYDYEEDDEDDEDDERHFGRGRRFPEPYRHRSYSPRFERRRRSSVTPPGRDGGALGGGGGRGPLNGYLGGPPPHPSQPYPQPYPYHAYYDQPQPQPQAPPPPQRPLYADAGDEKWGWPGDVKQQPAPAPPPRPLPADYPAPAQHPPMGGPPYGWDDGGYGGWGDSYRHSRGHAEYEMTELDG